MNLKFKGESLEYSIHIHEVKRDLQWSKYTKEKGSKDWAWAPQHLEIRKMRNGQMTKNSGLWEPGGKPGESGVLEAKQRSFQAGSSGQLGQRLLTGREENWELSGDPW